jgi:hypothetical protein
MPHKAEADRGYRRSPLKKAKTPAKTSAKSVAKPTARKKPWTPDPTRKKTPQEIASAKIKKSPLGADKQTAYARAHFIGGSADQAKREKARRAAFKPTSATSNVPKGYTQLGFSRLSPRQQKLVRSIEADNKRRSS